MSRLIFKTLLFICITFFVSKTATTQNLKQSNTDTLNHKLDSVMAKPDIFETAFSEGTQIYVGTSLLTFHSINIGNINVESGNIIACDPVMMYNNLPFNTKFLIGQFPVQLAIAKIDSNEIIAYSRILFSSKPVVNWEFALIEGQKPISIFGDSAYFYPVDGGLGQFIDEKMYSKFDKMDSNAQSEVIDSLIEELDKNAHASKQYADFTFKNLHIIAFSSGLGDGRYSTYVGYDESGKPCRLLTDFDIVDWLKK